MNLNEHCGPDGTVDWEALRKSVATSTRFLDDVVEANAYVPAVPQLTEAAHQARRIGLGIMGLADLMYHVGVRYGSEEGQEFGAQVMEFVRYHAMQTSIELAQERGPFPAIEGSIYDMDNVTWTPPQSLAFVISITGTAPKSGGMRLQMESKSMASATPRRPPSHRPARSQPSRAAKAMAANRSLRWRIFVMSTITARI